MLQSTTHQCLAIPQSGHQCSSPQHTNAWQYRSPETNATVRDTPMPGNTGVRTPMLQSAIHQCVAIPESRHQCSSLQHTNAWQYRSPDTNAPVRDTPMPGNTGVRTPMLQSVTHQCLAIPQTGHQCSSPRHTNAWQYPIQGPSSSCVI